MSYNIISGSGEIVECRLDSKLSEIYDIIYLETDSLKEKYKDVVSGIVVDKKKYDHVMANLLRVFKCKDSDQLVNLLNNLNSSLAASEHVAFFFERFSLSSYLYQSIETILEGMNPPVTSSNLYDDLYKILDYSKINSSVHSELAKEIDYFIKKANNTCFENKSVSSLKKKYSKPFIIEKAQLKGIKELNNIIMSIDRLHEIHICLYCEISDLYNSMMKITSIINSLR